jgi:hypothetical protein
MSYEQALARQQVHLAEELRGAVPCDLVARGIQDSDLAIDDRGERVVTIPDPVKDVTSVRRALLAYRLERGELRPR